MLNVAIVGCGKIADGHVEEIRKLNQAKVVACCDREPLMAEQLAVRYGIPGYYPDLTQMLASERVDVVHVTTPPMSHLELAIQAMDAGCHVYVEKPFALNAGETQKILQHAVRTQRKVTIGYEYNFDPPALAVNSLVREGVIGDPVHIEAFYGYDLSGAYGSALLGYPGHWVHKLPGRLFHNIIDHVVNKLVPFFPEYPTVRTVAYRKREHLRGDITDDVMDELRFILAGGGVSGYGTFSSHAKPVGHSLRVYGTKNTIHADFVARTVVLEHEPKLPGMIGRMVAPFGTGFQYLREGRRNVWRFLKSDYQFFAGLRRLISIFYDSILQDSPPPIPYEQILTVSRLMDEIFVQIRQEVTCS